MPPWLQHAVVVLMTQDAASSNYKSTLLSSALHVNVAHNVRKEINEDDNENSNNYQKLCAYILHIL